MKMLGDNKINTNASWSGLVLLTPLLLLRAMLLRAHKAVHELVLPLGRCLMFVLMLVLAAVLLVASMLVLVVV